MIELGIGYIAWHPDFNYDPSELEQLFAFHENEVWQKLTELYELNPGCPSLPKCVATTWNDIDGGPEPEEIFTASGWSIKRCKIVLEN